MVVDTGPFLCYAYRMISNQKVSSQMLVQNIPNNSFIEISPCAIVQVDFTKVSETLKDGSGTPLVKIWFVGGGYCYMPADKEIKCEVPVNQGPLQAGEDRA